MEHLVLIDGHHLMYRAYWAIPRTLKTKRGEQVNTVFGMASMLLTCLQQEQPDRFLLCFDAGEETFRHEQNATYKDGRAETPDDFYVQIPRVMELIDVMGFKHVSGKKFEADDFLCAYATAAAAKDMRVTIVTGDRDALQLATDRIRVAVPHGGYRQTEYLGPDEIFAKYGIRPDQVVDYKGLTGDASDNLPGVNGIGPKTASELLQTYGTLESIYENLGDIRASVRAKLEKDRESAFFCKHMATLVCDIPLDPTLDDLRIQPFDLERVRALFTELEFTLVERKLRELLRTQYGARLGVDTEPEIKKDSSTSQLVLF